MEPKTPSAGVERWVIHGDRMTMAYLRLQSGADIPLHSHPHDQMGMVFRGALELRVKDQRKQVLAGEIYHIPPHAEHGGKCLESPTEVLEVFSPAREDLS